MTKHWSKIVDNLAQGLIDDGDYPRCGECGEPIDYCQGHGLADGQTRCVLCGGKGADAEMYGQSRHGFADALVDHGNVHSECGLSAGWDVA